VFTTELSVGTNVHGKICITVVAVACLNAMCHELTLRAQLSEYVQNRASGIWGAGKSLRNWPLLPDSSAKPQPDYIPKALRDDYFEACKIRDLSPKASATLARRCLQGMIRDFCKIAKGRLIDEIQELEQRVADGQAPLGVLPDSVEAIDHVRKIGNIGAHMEKDINLIIDIDPGEAQILIELVETLFEEWYIARQVRTEKFAALKALGAKKEAEKNTPKP